MTRTPQNRPKAAGLGYMSRFADYIFAGPGALEKSRPADPNIWLGCFLSLEKVLAFRDPTERLAVYQPPRMWRDTGEVLPLPIIRKVVWNRAADRHKALDGSLTDLALSSELFHIRAPLVAELASLTLKLDDALPEFPFESGERSAHPKTYLEDSGPEHAYSVTRGYQFTSLEMAWRRGISQRLDEAFERLWTFLEATCTLDAKADDDWIEEWLIQPETYATMLRSALGLDNGSNLS